MVLASHLTSAPSGYYAVNFAGQGVGSNNQAALKAGLGASDQKHDQSHNGQFSENEDTVELSSQAQKILLQAQKVQVEKTQEKSSAIGSAHEYTPEEEQSLKSLKERDREVRAHEGAHQSAGGQFAGAASYTYEVGVDGKRYAIGGEVAIDTSPVKGDLKATIDKFDKVIAAALAPAKPSGQDRQIAAAVIARRAKAIAELAAEKARASDEKINKSDDKNNDPFGLYSDKRNGFYGLIAKNAYEVSSKLG